MKSFYRGRAVIVTGGLGFIGSNLANALVKLGAKVTIIDSRTPGCGANPENISSISSQVRVIQRDIGEAAAFRPAIAEAKTIFNLAGEVSHTHSVDFPARDLQLNTLAHLQFLSECAQCAPGVRVVYAGTRQVYGVAEYLPVNESHPIQPVDFNGVHKHAAAEYHAMLTRAGRLDAIVLRLSNVYGPRMGVHVPCQGFLPVFFRRLLRNEPIEIYGEGQSLRDPVFVQDVVKSFLIAGRIASPRSRVYNIGGPAALPIHQIARVICEAAGVSAPVRRPFPEALRAIDIGGYQSDCSLASRELHWAARTTLDRGVAATLAHYRTNWTHYQELAKSSECQLPEPKGAPKIAIA